MGGHQLHNSLPRATLAAPASHPPSCSEMPLLAAASSSSSRSFLPARSWDSSQQASNFAHLAASHLWCQCPCSLPSVRLWHPLSLGVTPWKLPLAGGRQQSAHAAAGTAKGAQSFHSSLDRVVLPGGKAVAVTPTSRSVFPGAEPLLKPPSAVGAELEFAAASSQHSLPSQALCPVGSSHP